MSNGYGSTAWSGFTAGLDSAAANAGISIQTTGSLNDAATVDAAGAIWVDLRNNGTTGTFRLSAQESQNLSGFIASGRRVVFIGENSTYTRWNRSFLGLVGAGFSRDASAISPTSVAVAHPLLRNVATIDPTVAGAADLAGADTPTPLFSEPVATLFGSDLNVLAILDSELFADASAGAADNAAFRDNTIDWIVAGAAAPVPSPLGGGGVSVLLSLLAARRQRRVPL